MNPLLDVRSTVNLGRRFIRTKSRQRRAVRANRAAYYLEAWTDAALRTGSTIEPLGGGLFRISNAGRNVIVSEQLTPLNDAVTDRLIRNRDAVFRLFEKLNAPRPRSILLKRNDLSVARSFMREIDAPVVVKPAAGTGAGAGIVTNVSDRRTLAAALAWAGAFCPETIIEEQIPGHVYRLLFLDGQLLDTVVRNPPMLRGDGVSTIRRLIQNENRLRATPGARIAQSLLGFDLDTRNSLATQGLSLASKPEAGREFRVMGVVNDNRAEENEAPPRPVHQSLLTLAKEVSTAIGVRLVGIDIIAESLVISLDESGGRVIEINTPPGHFYHHLRSGEGYPVAFRLLEQMFPAQVDPPGDSRRKPKSAT